MFLTDTKLIFSRLRSAAYGLSAAGLFCVCLLNSAEAQRVVSSRPTPGVDRLDSDEASERLKAFRQQRLAGDYCFRFELVHLPSKAKKRVYTGTMWGSWNGSGPITRFQIFSDSSDLGSGVIELIIQNGEAAKAWLRRGVIGDFELLEGADLFKPLLPGIAYRPFDLQMPFIYWDNFKYVGTGVVQSRSVQQFEMYPPEDSYANENGVHAVRLGLDDNYDALLRVEVLDTSGDELTRFTIGGWKKVEGQYVVKEVTIKDYTTGDRTRFEVEASSVGLKLNPAIFNVDRLVEPPYIPESNFTR